MALTQVARYYSRWDLDNHIGRIALFSNQNSFLDNRTYSSPEEFKLIVEMLRYEKPLFYDDATHQLRSGDLTAAEPVGEEES
jgi:hypothetical protein